ncbi:MAG: short-chain dehydrogenase/reductase [Sphingomonas bacterium]|jgi:NAD(P)-dependent dehydrogenase (short-subunit alcohol dehydrogenase family)|uniref:SDR family NAD(P)-dependent oxidoreductase n=1 Tax=Sphingomonas bacterium TaxID=1895847 RepID=UPI0026048AAF|nr:glucose 1-dehydrogenase [Sphingomonas bacterium]MDB5703874.1 short-chain dehydrogenase/reductase [Sphingomonas bacterium]
MTDYFDLTGKIALVTGGSRGLGLDIAKGLAACGAEVIVVSRKLEACEAAVAEIEAAGGKAIAAACHVGNWAEIGALVEMVKDRFGRLDILVNNAGLGPGTPVSTDVTEELFDKVLAVNLKGPFRLAALMGEMMREKGGGSIVNITSTAAVKPKAETSIYAAAKAGLNAMTKSHAFEFGPTVRVNAIMCGPFWTDISKSWREEADRTSQAAAKRIGRPHEIVTTALYLASPHSSFTTGSIIQLDGGLP